MKKLLTSLLIALIVLLPAVGSGTMRIRSYQAQRHYRFYTGADKNFIGTLYDFSGVGYSSDGWWATLVSDNYFISAYHAHPGTNQTVTFYLTNDLTGTKYTYTVAGGTRIGSTDLWIGWFNTAVDSSIERYPVLTLPDEQDYQNLVLYNYGKQDLVGRNVLEKFGNYSAGRVFFYDYDNNDTPSVGGDEAYLQSGDSGAPSFVVYNDNLTLVGIHWAIDSSGSYDTFVPEYVDEVNAVLAAKGQSLSEAFPVPEPDIKWYSMIISCSLWILRRRRSAP